MTTRKQRKKSRRAHKDLVNGSSHNRSRITNGNALLPDIDGRSIWARRFRDLIELHVADLGGPDNCSEAERSVLRRAATLTVELEYQEQRLAELRAEGEEPSEKRLELYSRLAGQLRRLLESVGFERRTRDATPPDPLDYARNVTRAGQSDEDRS